MPKYLYSCSECGHSFKIYHSSKEKLKNCPQCEVVDGLKREVNKVFIKKQEENLNKNIGDITKEFIEDNREILKDYKKDLENNIYDETPTTD